MSKTYRWKKSNDPKYAYLLFALNEKGQIMKYNGYSAPTPPIEIIGFDELPDDLKGNLEFSHCVKQSLSQFLESKLSRECKYVDYFKATLEYYRAYLPNSSLPSDLVISISYDDFCNSKNNNYAQVQS